MPRGLRTWAPYILVPRWCIQARGFLRLGLVGRLVRAARGDPSIFSMVSHSVSATASVLLNLGSVLNANDCPQKSSRMRSAGERGEQFEFMGNWIQMYRLHLYHSRIRCSDPTPTRGRYPEKYYRIAPPGSCSRSEGASGIRDPGRYNHNDQLIFQSSQPQPCESRGCELHVVGA